MFAGQPLPPCGARLRRVWAADGSGLGAGPGFHRHEHLALSGPSRRGLAGLPAEPPGEIALVGQADRRTNGGDLHPLAEQFLGAGQPVLGSVLPEGESGFLLQHPVEVIAMVAALPDHVRQRFLFHDGGEKLLQRGVLGAAGTQPQPFDPAGGTEQRQHHLEDRHRRLPAQRLTLIGLQAEEVSHLFAELGKLRPAQTAHDGTTAGGRAQPEIDEHAEGGLLTLALEGMRDPGWQHDERTRLDLRPTSADRLHPGAAQVNDGLAPRMAVRVDRGVFGQVPVHGEAQHLQARHPQVRTVDQERAEGLHSDFSHVEKVLVCTDKILTDRTGCWYSRVMPPPLIPVILVTGASRGLGRGISLQLARQGYSVAINYVGNLTAALDTAAQCRAAALQPEQRFVPIQADISRKEDRIRLVADTLKELGRIDALVNNAGIAPRQRADITEATEESFEELLRTNLQGPYFLTQGVARHWLNDRPTPALPSGFKIVFVTSVSADTVSTARGEYCVSKAGLAMAAQLWAARLAAENVQVVELRPGIMETDMTAGVREKYDQLLTTGIVPQRRWGTPADVGLAVGAVLAGSFPFSTGAVIPIDGGFHIPRL